MKARHSAICLLAALAFVPLRAVAQDGQAIDAGVTREAGKPDASLGTPGGPRGGSEQESHVKESSGEGLPEVEANPSVVPAEASVEASSPKRRRQKSSYRAPAEEAIVLPDTFQAPGGGDTADTSDLRDLVSVVVDKEHGPAAYWGWLVLALLAWLIDRTLTRRSARFLDEGLLPSLQSIASLLWRASGLMAVVFFGLRALPMDWLPDLKWVVFGGALIVAWSVRGVLSDLVARLVIALDGKVRPRLMVQTPELTGRVARIGIRKTDIVDAIGRTWAIPNRRLLSAQVREPSETHVHASLRLSVPNKRVIEDAALASAWIHPSGDVHVWRDESDSNLWHVETELISHDYERVFRSDIAERVREHHLEQAPSSPAPSSPAPSSLAPPGAKEPEAGS